MARLLLFRQLTVEARPQTQATTGSLTPIKSYLNRMQSRTAEWQMLMAILRNVMLAMRIDETVE